MTLEELAKELENISNNFSRELEKEVGRGVKVIQAEAKMLAPVDTGNLRNNITTDVDREGDIIVGKVDCNAEYAPYVEYGTGIYSSLGTGRQTPWIYRDSKGFHYTRGQHPQPFMNPAFNNNIGKVVNNLEDFVKRLIKW